MNTTIYTVSELNFATQKILEGHFSNILIEGEISNLARPGSGHLYFSLKDAKAQIRCAMFRTQSRSIPFELRNGLLVQLKAKVSIYPDRGDYQLIVETLTLAGDGALRLAYEQLVRKLGDEGLFQEIHKQAIPLIPAHIAVITSPTGAAIRDILSVLKRRFPSIPITLLPSKVQGTDAFHDLVRAIKLANQIPGVEVIILARGGGSLEDLWPFNEEAVARAIFASTVPIVTGIGHEIDFTIADFVADKRAATPSAAAELVSPNQQEWAQHFRQIEQRLKNEMIKRLQYRDQQLDNLLKRLRHPGKQIEDQMQRLYALHNRLLFCIQGILKEKRHFCEGLFRTLHTVSPFATLSRGYTIVSNISSGKIIRSVSEVAAGERLNIKCADGEIQTLVQMVQSSSKQKKVTAKGKKVAV